MNKHGEENHVCLELKNVTKTFPGVLALDSVNLKVHDGEIHGVVGENGAGKSTMCNVITGIHSPNEGQMIWHGEEVWFNNPNEAIEAGIRMVYQERNLVPFLTGAQNIFLGNKSVEKGMGMIDEDKVIAEAKALADRLGAINIPLDVKVERLTASQRQMIEILRAFAQKPELLLLDEPTASLTEGDIDTLFNVLQEIKKQGVSVIFISHKLPEIFRITDNITVLRNGAAVYHGKTDETTREELIFHMVNRRMDDQFPAVTQVASDETILELINVSDGPRVRDVNLYVNKGEVVGFYGLVGSGRTELVETIFGLRRLTGGKVIYNGEEYTSLSAHENIQNGMIMVPEDRQHHGVFNVFNIKQNVSLAYLESNLSTKMGWLKLGQENQLALDALKKMEVKYKSLTSEMSELSGGNKQKVVIARWLLQENMNLIFMDEPTQGIDVGTKYEIYLLLRSLAEEEGVGAVFISSELPELLGVCDRLYIFKEGHVVKEFQRDEFDEETVLHHAI